MLDSYFAESSCGPHLDINEDAIIVDVSKGLFGVIDGYGGTGIGDVIAELVKNNILDSFGLLSKDEDATMPLFFNPNYSIETNALINALKLSHAKVKEYNDKKDSSSRGGSSFLGCTLSGNRLQYVSTGNCLALTLRDKKVLISNFPHASSTISITGSEAEQNYPLSGIGLFDHLDFFVQDAKIEKGDKTFLFTSGAYVPFNLTELAILLMEFGHQQNQLNAEIFKLTKSRGHKGNQSIVCLQF